MEWWQTTIVICGALVTVFTLWDRIEARVKSLNQPTKTLEQRVDELERKVDLEYKSILAGYDEKLQRDYDSINSIKKTMNLVIKSQWVLVKHAEDGNNVQQLKEVSKELSEYIFEK